MKRQFKESLFFDGIRTEVGLDKDYTSACCRSLTANGLRKHWHRVRRGRRGTCLITRCTSKAQEKTQEFVKVYCSPDGLLNSDAGESSFEELRASRCCTSRNAASSENIARELSPLWEKCKKHDSETSRNAVSSENIARELSQIWEKCKKHDSESFAFLNISQSRKLKNEIEENRRCLTPKLSRSLPFDLSLVLVLLLVPVCVLTLCLLLSTEYVPLIASCRRNERVFVALLDPLAFNSLDRFLD
ncbi:hypothetical protein T12_1918 [Trichinella patagoniensis]|uniref:Uncharacterized protein n=1 Tax=Trichinella patagoniensis TaxID=990121 RepID=A0A0V0ZAQ1_9BILA|nr:hypothetical protein T12_1918 [Trichinella patagoniensis]